MNRALCCVAALSLLSVSCLAVGDIEGPAPRPTQPSGGAASGGTAPPGDDLPDPDPETAPEPAPPPPDENGGAPPPSGSADGGAPPPPASDGGAPPPPAADDAAAAPTYPAGPYGLSVGAVMPNASLSGYRGGTGAWSTITMRDYFDPTGSRGIRGLLVTVSASWCGACREEAKDLVAMSAEYAARGGRFLTSMIEDNSGAPAKQSTVDAWIAYSGVNFDIVADANRVTLKNGAGLPFNLVIDTRTMKVVRTWSGTNAGATSIPELDAVLVKNGG